MNDFVSQYDEMIFYCLERKSYFKKDFFNVGFWLSHTLNQEEACENIVDKLLEFIPDKKGKILDVGCGLGATTNHLLNYYPASNVVGINISQKQVEKCRLNAPGCTFIVMNAVKMEFEDNSFDNIICVEAAFHFDTRNEFLQEAWRVLKPGGHLVLADIIFESTQWVGEWLVPLKNNVRNMEEYKDTYLQAGFKQVELIDVTNQSWGEYCRRMMSWLQDQFSAEKVDEPTFRQYMTVYDGMLNSSVKHYLMASAKKP
ncbi:methyltransferase domain-containing protein [Moorena producens]|uniref:methyltransferase domain-containing protein n=1 Tax=Moorena producens TaxID=1155739 RepID=UPI003C72063B